MKQNNTSNQITVPAICLKEFLDNFLNTPRYIKHDQTEIILGFDNINLVFDLKRMPEGNIVPMINLTKIVEKFNETKS